jgi:hypothetical protein
MWKMCRLSAIWSVSGYINGSEPSLLDHGALGFRELAAGPSGLLSLYICEGSPRFASKRLFKAREQGLI